MVNKLTTEEFIKKAKEIHGNKYDYSLSVYKKSLIPVKIVCPIHGEFEQTPHAHLSGKGCKPCGRSRGGKKKTLNEFIEEAKQVHGDKYDYSKAEWNGIYEKMEIICRKHGVFLQLPGNHVKYGCRYCSFEQQKKYYIDNKEAIHDKVKKTNLKRYGVEYPLQNKEIYKKSHSNSNVSQIEKIMSEYLNELSIDYTLNDRCLIYPKELDIIIPDYKLAIEFDGLYWHSEVYKDKNYHKMKTDMVEQQEYQLIHIFEDEWLEKPELIKRMLKHKLGLDNDRVYARKCSIKQVSFNDHKQFMEQNHIQGSINASVRLGLYYQDDLVACISFKRLDDQGNYDLVRYATSKNIVGGFSKLLKAFQDQYNWNSIITFANRRYSQGSLYSINGFNHVYNTKPNYYYIKSHSRFSRNQFQKHKLKKQLETYDPNLTEHQNMLNNGYYRIYDCGHMKFRLDNPNCMP